MTYDLNQIADYAAKIESKYKGIRLILHPGASWNNAVHELKIYKEVLRKSKHQSSLRNYALTLQYLAQFLARESEKDQRLIAIEQQSFLDEQLKFLKTAYREIHPDGELKAPLPKLFPSKYSPAFLKNNKTSASLELQDFLDNSLELKSLKNYLHKVLNEDKRSHSYFFCIDFSEKRKVGALNQFICDINSLSTMSELKDFLKNFYQQKGQIQSTSNECSRFDIFNRGQNFSTRVLRLLFGKKTTTTSLIDEFALRVGINPDEWSSKPATYS
ncbi:MAG: hypothetical protein H0U70_11625 [Tatlockia sp.]|nr:hypothetical protein [Tatlockia sp.]